MNDVRASNPDPAVDVEQLKARIKELEDQLHARPARTGGGGPGAVTAVLGLTTVVMAVPTFLTIRRWVQWWQQ